MSGLPLSETSARLTSRLDARPVLTDDSGLRFQSNMTERQHKAFNQLLNKRVEEAANPSYPFAPVRYAHTREVDSFHEMNTAGQGGKRKVRVTRDQKDPNKVLRVVEKTRIADMNIFSPKRLFDWRVSVSVEMPGMYPARSFTRSTWLALPG